MDARVNIKGEYTPKEEFVKFFREYAWHIFFFLQVSPNSDQYSLSWYK